MFFFSSSFFSPMFVPLPFPTLPLHYLCYIQLSSRRVIEKVIHTSKGREATSSNYQLIKFLTIGSIDSIQGWIKGGSPADPQV